MCLSAIQVFILRIDKYLDDYWDNIDNRSYYGQDNCDMKFQDHPLP